MFSPSIKFRADGMVLDKSAHSVHSVEKAGLQVSLASLMLRLFFLFLILHHLPPNTDLGCLQTFLVGPAKCLVAFFTQLHYLFLAPVQRCHMPEFGLI